MTPVVQSYSNMQLRPFHLAQMRQALPAAAVNKDTGSRSNSGTGGETRTKKAVNRKTTVKKNTKKTTQKTKKAPKKASKKVRVKQKGGLSLLGTVYNGVKGFAKGVYGYTIGLAFNPIKMALVMGAALGGTLLAKKNAYPLTKALKGALLTIGAAGGIKGMFDMLCFLQNNKPDKAQKAAKNIDSFGQSCAYMGAPLLIPLVPKAAKFLKTEGKDITKYILRKLI